MYLVFFRLPAYYQAYTSMEASYLPPSPCTTYGSSTAMRRFPFKPVSSLSAPRRALLFQAHGRQRKHDIPLQTRPWAP